MLWIIVVQRVTALGVYSFVLTDQLALRSESRRALCTAWNLNSTLGRFLPTFLPSECQGRSNCNNETTVKYRTSEKKLYVKKSIRHYFFVAQEAAVLCCVRILIMLSVSWSFLLSVTLRLCCCTGQVQVFLPFRLLTTILASPLPPSFFCWHWRIRE